MKFGRKPAGLTFLACLIVIASFIGCASHAAARITEPPSHTGFRRIDSRKSFFIIVGDTRKTSNWEFWRRGNDRQRKEIADEIARRSPAFVINLGDLVLTGSSEEDWKGFDNLNRNLREEGIPYLPVLGNHELHGNRKSALDNYFERFPALQRRRWYDFTWKNAGFIMLDSNFGDLSAEQRKEQEKWYLKELERFDHDDAVGYVIVCCHEPPFTNGEVEAPNPEVRVYFADPFLRFRKTCLFFSGHAHTYERFEKEGKFFIVSGGGGAPRHRVDIDPATRKYKDLFSGPSLRFFHFCQVELRRSALVLDVVRLQPDGSFSVADSVTVNRGMQ